jgi:anti-sigma factor RsiW
MKHLTESALNEYLDRALPAARQQAAAAHLDQCSACRSRLADLRRVAASLAALPDRALPGNLAPGVLSALPARRLALGWKLAMAVQAGLAIGLVILAVQLSAPTLRPLVEAGLRPALGLAALRPPLLSLPAIRWSPLDLAPIHLPRIGAAGLDLSALNVIFLGVTAAALFLVGNGLLLGFPSRFRASRGGDR